NVPDLTESKVRTLDPQLTPVRNDARLVPPVAADMSTTTGTASFPPVATCTAPLAPAARVTVPWARATKGTERQTASTMTFRSVCIRVALELSTNDTTADLHQTGGRPCSASR